MRSVRPHPEAEKAAPVSRLVGLQHEGAGAVAEDDRAVALGRAPGARRLGDGPVRVAEEHGPVLGSTQGKNEAWHSAPTSRMRRAAPERMKASETWSPDRKPAHCMRMSRAGRRGEAEGLREHAAVAREVVVGRHRGEDDQVDVRRPRGPASVERAAGGLGAEDRRGLPAPGELALLDAGPLADPLVGRVHEPREPLVRDDALRHEHPGASDDGCREGHAPILPGRACRAGARRTPSALVRREVDVAGDARRLPPSRRRRSSRPGRSMRTRPPG